MLRNHTLVWLCVHASTQAAAETSTHLASYKVGVQLSLRAQDVCLERRCKMCLTSSLRVHAFPKMLQIPALDHTTYLGAGLIRFSLHVLLTPCV